MGSSRKINDAGNERFDFALRGDSRQASEDLDGAVVNAEDLFCGEATDMNSHFEVSAALASWNSLKIASIS